MAKETRGKIYGVAGPTVVASGMGGATMNTVCLVGKDGLLGEIIRVKDDLATLQVYEDTGGLTVGEDVVSYAKPLSVTLGPGLLTNIFDGIQRPLQEMKESGVDWIGKGLKAEPLDMDRPWEFTPLMKKGDPAEAGDVVGAVRETERIEHRVMVPPGMKGVIKEIRSGKVTGRDTVCTFEDGGEDGSGFGLYREWPVRKPRPCKSKLPPQTPFITGQRVFDTLLPVATGGTAI
ncbi:MAG: V-type ATP synthase subunit A, partial [Deltaproteobacteria bacterium]|nr:V-type ATP synthase subunit A [Deltaproteobacteria bacterium]